MGNKAEFAPTNMMQAGNKSQVQRSAVTMSASMGMPIGGSSSMSPIGGSSMSGQQLGGGANMFGDLASSVGMGFESIDNSMFTQQPQGTSRVAESFTPNNAQAMYMSSGN